MIEPPEAVMRPGGYTKAAALARAETARARRLRAEAGRELTRLEREAGQRRREAGQSDRRRSKRRLKPGASDAREKIDRARVTGKDGQAGRRLDQMAGRLEQARKRLAASRIRRVRRLGIRMYGEPARRDALFRLSAGRLPLGDLRELVFDELRMGPEDRIALVGPNGAGKSTLLRHIMSGLDLPRNRVVYLGQEIPLSRAERVLARVRRLPGERLGEMMTFVSHLGSDPERLLTTEAPSPGELRKLMLALGVAYRPVLIVMDEPTNHLDLPSIECLEDALDACRCGLLLASHDERFLGRLTRTRWEIAEASGSMGAQMRLRIATV
jgi:ATPase subunit of ABC transporter with duplicated ATPase domains